MFSDEIVSIATQQQLLSCLNNIEEHLVNHDKHFISKITLSSRLDSSSSVDPKILFGQNGIWLCQALLYRSKSLIEGSIICLNQHNILSAVMCIRSHYETTGKIAYILKRLNSYYNGNIDFETIFDNITKSFVVATPVKHDDVPVTPVQVMCLIDSVDHIIIKSGKNNRPPNDTGDKLFRSMYDNLCNYCHPNLNSNALGYSLEGENLIFYKTDPMNNTPHFKVIFNCLNISSMCFLMIYEDTVNLLKRKETMPIIHKH